MLSAEQRKTLKIAGEPEVDRLISSDNPPPILLGGAADLETAMIRCAVQHHYTQRRLANGVRILLPPDRSPGKIATSFEPP